MEISVVILVFTSIFTTVYGVRLATANETNLGDGTDTYDGPDPWTNVPCDFNGYSTCGWTNIHSIPDDFDWRHGYGRDSHKNRRRQRTGSKDDHRGGGGYMYISSGRHVNRTAKLATEYFKQTEPACLTFYYHMRGRHMGHLKLYDYETSDWKTNNNNLTSSRVLWTIWGNQGQFWQQGTVQIPAVDSSKRRMLLFEAFDWEKGPAGNVLLDDIEYDKINAGSRCIFTPSDAAPPTSEPPPTTTTTTTTTVSLGTTAQASVLNTTELNTLPSNRTVVGPTTISTNLTSAIKSSGMQPTMDENVPTSTSIPTSATPVSISKNDNDTDKVMTTAPNAIKKTKSVTKELTTSGLAVSKKPSSDGPVVYIVVGVVCALIVILAVALLLYFRQKKRRRFSYYENCTVHMSRVAADGIDRSQTPLQYYKLT